jgi:hypothetical protein
MAVQKEIKSQLAKLLATEDIVVEHKQCETAQFNVHTRVLTLPMWEKASNHVYDMLVGHEVGHALFTPDDWSWEGKIPQQFVNVCEDARIEKLMKRKYMGIAKSFYRGYSELHEKDFFELDGEDLNNFNLADRANLYFKIGSFFDLSFSDAESEIITLIQNAETFTETIAAAETLYNFCKQEQQQKTSKPQEDGEEDLVDEPLTGNSSGTGDADTDSTDDNGSSVSDSNSDAPLESGSSSPNTSSGNSDSNDEPTVETAEAFNSSIQDLINYNGIENVYIERPDLNIENIIASNKEIHQEADYHWDQERVIFEDRQKKYHHLPQQIFEEVDAEFAKFKRDAQKEVSYLVKEFECKKAADAYARATTSRTGVLSTEKLHTYKFNEDLFKKISVVPDGKNHGLVFILDWSGSMATVMQDTIKQLYNLIWFCRKVSIPFEVYAFTNEWNNSRRNYETGQIECVDPKPLYEAKENLLQVEDRFTLMNLFTSKVNAKTLDHQLLNIWRTVGVFRNRYNSYYSFPHKLCLSGTPLNETLLSLHKIIPQFQKENKLQKVQCIILTDGEAAQLPYHKEVNRHWEDEPYLGCRNVSPSTSFFRDRKVGKTYKIGYGYHEFTDMLVQNLKDNFPYTNVIGIRVMESRDAKYFIKRYYDEWKNPVEYGKIMSEWRKTKAFNIKKSAYDAYFGMSSSALSDDSEFDVEDSATKAQIKRAFVKSLKTKKLNKKVLGEFIELVV